MKVLMASSEVHPYSKTGGLGDMVAGLAKTLARTGCEVGVVTPLYRGIRERHAGLKRLDWELPVPLGARQVAGEIWVQNPIPNLTYYFIHQPEFYDRKGLYNENGTDYADNADRFIFLSKAVAHLARYLPWKPGVVHVHDWQTALVPLLIKNDPDGAWERDEPRTVLTIHNLAYQGTFPAGVFGLTGLPWGQFQSLGAEFYGAFNCLKAGIVHADAVTTVSPRYAREITTEEFGCGLDGLLRERDGALHGILNGVDYEEWNTTANPHLPFQYSARDLSGKAKVKQALQRELGLAELPDAPLFGTVTRLVEQKGIDLLIPALEQMLAGQAMQIAILGSGEQEREKALLQLAAKHPGKAAVRIGYDHGLSHRIEAGSDFFLMPSRFEPCGLNQMYSLRYGAIPIVRAIGGLDDSVRDARENAALANGIKFHDYSPEALAQAIRKALRAYAEPGVMEGFRRNAMAADFSWERTAQRYLQLYLG